MDDKSGSEGSDSDASTSASDEEADVDVAPARKRSASNKARAAALDILQGQPTAHACCPCTHGIVFDVLLALIGLCELIE